MNVKSATLRFGGTTTALELVTDKGTVDILPPKLDFLANGFVVVGGPDVMSGRFPTMTGFVPADLSDGRPEAMAISPACDDLVVLELARRYAYGEYKKFDVPVPVPSFKEADDAQWEISAREIRRAK